MGKLSNLTIKNDENKVIIRINPKIYPLDVIYSAAYVFLDKTYVLIDGDPKKEVIVELKPKENMELEVLGGEFSNELLNYATYKTFSEKNKDVRTIIVQRALITGDPEIIAKQDDEELDAETKKILDNLESDDENSLDDPESIAIPWEEKYGKSAKRKNGRKDKAK